jgi:parallel beta-helix repeat protein
MHSLLLTEHSGSVRSEINFNNEKFSMEMIILKGGRIMKRWKKTLTTLGVVGLSALLLFVFPTSSVYAKDSGRPTHHVNCAFGQNIQNAVDKADDGSIISVSGSCTEHVNINKNRIWLKGTPGASISVPEGYHQAVGVGGSLVKISDFGNIEGDIQEGWIDGIAVYTSGSAKILNNVIASPNLHGIDVGFSGSAVIEKNLITGSLHTGIHITGASSARIRDNFIINNSGFGIGLYRLGSAEISGNTISGNGSSGIDVSSNSSIILPDWWGKENIIEDNDEYGVICGTSGAITIQIDPDFKGGNGKDNFYTMTGCDCNGSICPP